VTPPQGEPPSTPAPQPLSPEQADATTNDSADSNVGSRYVGATGIITMAVVIISLMALTGYSIVAIWPAATPAAALTAIHLFGIGLSINPDQQLFLIVAFSGALGGLIHSARSLYWYAGNRVLRRSWLLMYLSLPFIGSALATVFYIILRGGLLTGEAAAAVNYYGFAATSALVGLFSPEAAEKLKQVFATLLAPAESGRDRVRPSAEPMVQSFEPSSAHVGTTVVINGQNLSGSTAVLFHGARAPVSNVSEATVTVEVPLGASTGAICLVLGQRIINVPGILHIDQ
jgi:IPT/TIG domain